MPQDLSSFKSNYKFDLRLQCNDTALSLTFTKIGRSVKNLLRAETKQNTHT